MGHSDLHFRDLDDVADKSRREALREAWNEHRTDSRAALQDLHETMRRKRDRLHEEGEAAWGATDDGHVEQFYTARCRAVGMLLQWQEERGQPPSWQEAFGSQGGPTDRQCSHARTVVRTVEGRDPDEFGTYADVERWVDGSDVHEAPPTGQAVAKGAKRCADALGYEHDDGASLLRALRRADREGQI